MSWRELNDTELAEQIERAREVLAMWQDEAEEERRNRGPALPRANARCNQWHARINGLLAEQKRRAA